MRINAHTNFSGQGGRYLIFCVTSSILLSQQTEANTYHMTTNMYQEMWIAVAPIVYTVHCNQKQIIVQHLPTPSTEQHYCSPTKLN